MNVFTYAKRVALTAAITLLVLAAFYLLARHAHFFLLVFAGILLAALFCGITNWLQARLHVSRGLGLLISAFLVFGVLGGLFWLVAPRVSSQFDELGAAVPEGLGYLKERLGQYAWAKKLVAEIPVSVNGLMPAQKATLSRFIGIFSSTLDVLADLVVIIVTALFFASEPKLYTKGVVRLFPVRNRTRVMEVLNKCYEALKMWLVGMLSAMTIVGVSTAIGYSLIGLPVPFALAVIAFLLAFIPNIGPWLAGVPAVLIGLTVGPQMALYTVLVYGGVQLIETYWITPIIFQKTVDLPPALLLFFQVLLGTLAGALGLLLAAPILAVILVLVEELYVQDVLEKEPLDAAEERASHKPVGKTKGV
ncbi:putative PurR-regulated permease PerM [Pontibacter ummariensis]|uniref:Predicted PurR-regulated permease PerM n=1 Tax=Pontibacter ummariensis TaxID=1610492 RepID=A0A239ES84_9BACT|nr:AI-2E family transporter [Pontibacter ummariensis]PRY12775.1 putative PurR-regulated permease PerM [Pontibacter ummariensis]SNS47439.1 Predicted PurR-regulated permease PerM [Pontibacter ummariensis]